MDLGVALPTSGHFVSREAIVRVAQEAERLGYAAVWTYERLLYPIAEVPYLGGETIPLDRYYLKAFEAIETLSYVAAKTERVKLGTSIVNTPFHSPISLARRFATLDQFSDGRVIAGLGQGWMEQEFIATNSTRKYQGRGVEEFIAAMRAAWGENPVQFEGKFYQIPPAKVDPKPIQRGGIPIIMGAVAPSAMKRAGRMADGLNPLTSSLEGLEESINAFRLAAQEAGRDPSKLKIYARVNGLITTSPMPEGRRPFLGGSPDQIARDLDKVRRLNVEQVFFNEMVDPDMDEYVSSNLNEYIDSLGRLQSIVRA
jgi:probable F420-dependent oxidoreductase